MRIKFDTHTHTLASAHAYSTFTENVTFAAKMGMDGIAVTDHGPTIPDSPHEWHFGNLKNLPCELFGQKIMVGAEANITDTDGNLDLDIEQLRTLDVVNASIHSLCYSGKPGGDHTGTYEAVVMNPTVDIICHSGWADYMYDYEYIIKLAKKHKKLMEINNHTFAVRGSSIPNCRKIAELCKKHEVGIVVTSDAHFFTDIGNYSNTLAMLDEVKFPEELVMNVSFDRFYNYLKNERGKEPMANRFDVYKL